MSKQYRVSLPASRAELTHVLARLQDDTLQEPDRQLLMRLVQQLLGSSAGTPVSGTPLITAGKESERTTGSSESARPEQETHASKRTGHGRRSGDDYSGAQ
ncbi:MAG: hypothetical protein JO108_23885, partial [Acidobacteriaceae bacterium]|nr:hypothetical protein [Acidobacteriaceae bacterium]